MSGATVGGPIRDAAEWAEIAAKWVSALIQDELIPLAKQVRANGVDVTLPIFGGFTINIRAAGVPWRKESCKIGEGEWK